MVSKKKTRTGAKIVPSFGRKQRGRVDRSVMFPLASGAGEMPTGYAALLQELKTCIRNERLRVVLVSNSAMILLYWDVGQRILAKQADQGWGARVIDRLAADLRQAFPDMKGFSPRNLKYMRAFTAAWPDQSIVQRTVAQLIWGQNLALLEKLNTPEDRLWYAARTLEYGWSRNILAIQIEVQAQRRQGKAQK
jgi:predicted nuclease of restriction endonuclease-like (RecB) superfamily